MGTNEWVSKGFIRLTRGYRSLEHMIAMIYFVAGKLTIHYVPSHGK